MSLMGALTQETAFTDAKAFIPLAGCAVRGRQEAERWARPALLHGRAADHLRTAAAMPARGRRRRILPRRRDSSRDQARQSASAGAEDEGALPVRGCRKRRPESSRRQRDVLRAALSHGRSCRRRSRLTPAPCMAGALGLAGLQPGTGREAWSRLWCYSSPRSAERIRACAGASAAHRRRCGSQARSLKSRMLLGPGTGACQWYLRSPARIGRSLMDGEAPPHQAGGARIPSSRYHKSGTSDPSHRATRTQSARRLRCSPNAQSSLIRR